MNVPQLRAARAILGWSQGKLAAESGVSKPTVARLEVGTDAIGGYRGTREKLQDALEAAGVIFLAENGGGPGVRLRKTPAPTDHPRPVGPATEVVKQMDAAIDNDRKNAKLETIPLEDLNASNDE